MIATPRLSSVAIGNLATQALLFTAVAAIPALLTGKMSYVDIAWPWGLVAIADQVAVYSQSLGPAAVAISVVYVAIGLRMGAPGIVYLVHVGRLKAEFHRYRYQRIRWAAAGWNSERMPMQLEIYLQGLANASVLALPALLVASDHDQRLDPVRLTAPVVWLGCWSLEWLADRQKHRFGAPAFMLWTLVHLTGIKPSEHYSVRKRPEYAEYQRTTNSFIPGPRRPGEQPIATQEA